MSMPSIASFVVGRDADRRRRRELMRAHHPDLGGDPELFIQVLQRLDEEAVNGSPATEVRFARRRRWWVPDRRMPSRLMLLRRRRTRRVS
jgi:hypothetical protein